MSRLGLCGGVPALADAAAFALLGSSLRGCPSDDGGGLLAENIRVSKLPLDCNIRCLVDSFAEPILLGSSPFLKLHFADLSLSACSAFAPSRPAASRRKAISLGLCGGVEASSARGLAALELDSTVACGFSAFGEGLLRDALVTQPFRSTSPTLQPRGLLRGLLAGVVPLLEVPLWRLRPPGGLQEWMQC